MAPYGEIVAQQRETIRDRVVHLEEGPRAVPVVPRLEESLDLHVDSVDVGDAMLHVEEQGSGIPLVVINGGPGGTHHYFHPWFGRAASYARVIYYDQRGTGLSGYEPGPDGYSVDQAVADLDALRAALGVERWVLVGYSYGGFLAQYYTTVHPDRVAGLVLVGGGPGMWADYGSSRQWEYIADAERASMTAVRDELRTQRQTEGWSRAEYLQRIVYNNFINGDWKRQHYYRPTDERVARIARYEWVNDGDFNSVMSRSMDRVDLTGAFERNPISTLLVEGKWDLTWGDAKPAMLSRNHPNARMIVVEDAGHSVFEENPDVFFAELERFVAGLEPPSDEGMAAYRKQLQAWRDRWHGDPRYVLRSAGMGMAGSRRIADGFTPDFLTGVTEFTDMMRVGYALYDVSQYEDALAVFVSAEAMTPAGEQEARRAMALMWQGYVLDLQGRRDDARARYQRVVDMDVQNGVRHDQYGLAYYYGQEAADRLGSPFARIENRVP
jgi:proline iminopeptidase